MHYCYLALWIKETQLRNLSFKDIVKFEDQYLIRFKSNDPALQINLSSKDSFLFFSEKYKELDFDNSGDLNLINSHLLHSKVNQIKLDQNDRIIEICFEKYNIYNVLESLSLIIELSPRYQNIILCRKKEDQLLIIDCLRKISFAENNSRQVLPGLEYKKAETSYITQEITINYPLSIENEKIKYSDLKSETKYSTMNTLFEDLYYEHILNKRKTDLKNQIIKSINQTIKKKENKLKKLQAEMFTDDESEIFKKKGELLLASYSKIKNGDEKIILQDYYTEDYQDIEITLNKALSVKQNIDRYFKKYKKAESGRIKVQEQILCCQKEITSLENEIASILELNDLITIKSYKADEHSHFKEDKKKLFRRLMINDAWEIFIGRSSKENDLLTCKTAQSNDWWFHTRIFQGTHVVLRNYKKMIPNDDLLIFCSRLAAYYSRAKTSINVPVDYTQIKYVRKPRGSVSGYVTYTNQKTIFVTPLSIREAGEIIKNGGLK